MTTRQSAYRVYALFVDCKSEGCGGGIEGTDGSFELTYDNTMPYSPRDRFTCQECGATLRIPASALKALRVSR